MDETDIKIWKETWIDVGMIGISGIYIAMWENGIKLIPNNYVKTIFSLIAVVAIFGFGFISRRLVHHKSIIKTGWIVFFIILILFALLLLFKNG